MIINTRPMDTGDLSEEAYRAIIIEAELFNHNLTLQFGLLSYECEDENNFIEKSILLINDIRTFNEWMLEDMFFGESYDKNQLYKTLDRILVNIENYVTRMENGEFFDE